MRILSTLLISFFFLQTGLSQFDFQCDSLGLEAPFGLNTVFTPESPVTDTEMCVEFRVENFVDVIGTTATISFDPSQIEWVSSSSLLVDQGSVNFNNTGVDLGQLSFLWTDFTVQGITLPDDTPFIEMCFLVTAEPGEVIEFFFNDNLSPNFPTTEVLYQASATSVCEDEFIVLNGGTLASVEVNCSQLSVTNISSCQTGPMDGVISVNICGGVSPYNVEFENTTIGIASDTSFVTAPDPLVLSNLAEGAYNLTISDANGESITTQIQLTVTDPIIYDAVTTNPTCFYTANGSIDIFSIIGGTPPYTFENSNGLFLNGQMETSFENLRNGDYTITISDSQGCNIEENFTLDTPEFEFDIEFNSPTCASINDGFVSLTVSGGTPFPNGQYIINGIQRESYETDTPTQESAFNNQTQMFSFVVEDMKGCLDGVNFFLPYLLPWRSTNFLTLTNRCHYRGLCSRIYFSKWYVC